MPRPLSLGISTPIPTVPVNPKGYLAGTDKRKRLAHITPEWHRSRLALFIPPGHAHMDVDVDGMEVGVARCKAVEIAREQGLRYLFFLDWDVLVPPDALAKLVYRLENYPDYDVAAGLYCLKSDPPWPLLWRDWNQGVAWDWTVGDVLLDRVVGVPMGCTLLRLSLFDRLEQAEGKPWFKTVDEIVDSGQSQVKSVATEDLYFCQRLLNEAAGKMLVDTGILCEHICHTTGRRYHLDTESLPWRRARESAGQ